MNIKISDKEFLTILRENAGLFSRTAKAIEKQFKIDYTRQAVRERALKFPEELIDIREQNIDVAEDGLFSLMKSDNDNVKMRAIELYLKTIGKARGYVEKVEQQITGGMDNTLEIKIVKTEFPISSTENDV